MDAARVLLIESIRANGRSFSSAIEKHYTVSLAYSGKQGVVAAQQDAPDIVVLDAVSMRTTGDRICRSLRNTLPETPIIHIREAFASKEASSDADIVLHYPFTWRKLMNRVKRFAAASDSSDVLTVGNMRLNTARRVLIVGDQERDLTPKVASLAALFFQQPNIVFDRKTLVQKVWQTDYVGDTRTLDVHIRWLREALEENPSKPKLIKTIRGVGYRLVSPA